MNILKRFFTRRRKLTDDDYELLAEEILDKVMRNEDLDDIEVHGLNVSFEARYHLEQQRAYTGVEFMGSRESYLQVTCEMKSLHCSEARDRHGRTVEVLADTARLANMVEALSNKG